MRSLAYNLMKLGCLLTVLIPLGIIMALAIFVMML